MSNFVKSSIEPAWCPGCGHFSIRDALVKALNESNVAKKDLLLVSGIGQAAKSPQYIEASYFNGLHGRSLPTASGAKLVNRDLQVIVQSGDGCSYGEGGNHFLAALRRNLDLTMLVNNNQIYGLTKGQASPTSDLGMVTKSQPQGVMSYPIHPLSVAISMGAGFVARSFSGDINHLSGLIKQAMAYKGFALIDILTPCVSFNKINTFAWYKKRVKPLADDYDPTNFEHALKTSSIWGDEIPIGVLYYKTPPDLTMEDRLGNKKIVGTAPDLKKIAKALEKYTC